jgi:hypothetical protein
MTAEVNERALWNRVVVDSATAGRMARASNGTFDQSLGRAATALQLIGAPPAARAKLAVVKRIAETWHAEKAILLLEQLAAEFSELANQAEPHAAEAAA